MFLKLASNDDEHYKDLRYDSKEYKRVHVGHFVPVLKFNITNNLILLIDFNHHNVIYKFSSLIPSILIYHLSDHFRIKDKA